MASVACQLIQEVTAHAQSDSLEDAREICADGTYFPNNLRIFNKVYTPSFFTKCYLLHFYHAVHSVCILLLNMNCWNCGIQDLQIGLRSFSSLSNDRSNDSSKTIPPHFAIHSFLLQMTVSSAILNVIQ